MFAETQEIVNEVRVMKTWDVKIYRALESEFMFWNQNKHVKDREWIEDFKELGPRCYAYCLILIKDFDKNEVIKYAEEVLGLSLEVK